MTFEEKFTKLSKKLIKADTEKINESFAIQITIDDEDCGGTFFVVYNDGAFRVEPYDYIDNTLNINIMSDALDKLISKKLTVENAVEEGFVSYNGNIGHLVALMDAFEKKVTTTKKTTKTVKKVEDKPVKKEDASSKKTTKKSTAKK